MSPLVKITYDWDAEHGELPLIAGVLADFSGLAERPPLSARSFIEVNRDNFDSIFHTIGPGRPATWCALQYLVDHATGENVKIRILDVSKKELYRDQSRAPDFHQSILFKKLHDDIFGTSGASPFGILIGDYQFSNTPADFELLERLSQVAAAIHAPFLAEAAAPLLGVNNFADLAVEREFRPIFKTPEYAHWRSFRQSEAARYVCLTAPRALFCVDPFPVWGGSAFALAARIISAFTNTGWFAQIRGRQGGAVAGLPKWTFAKCQTSAEVVLELWQQKALAESGLISFGHHHGPSDGFAFVPTCYQPAIYENPDGTETARLASDLRYVLCISRFVHCLRVIIRDQLGGSVPESSRKQMLNSWIAQYVSGQEEPSAAKPLGSAYVEISAGTVSLFALPRFQLEAMIYGMRAIFRLQSF
jgi:type VI secretion system protein ImpC